jgi:hypothetical protein
MRRKPFGLTVIHTAVAAIVAVQAAEEEPIAEGIREALGKAAPVPAGVDDGKRIKIRPCPPTSPHYPAPQGYTIVDDIAYVRENEYEKTIERIYRARAKQTYGENH